MENLVELLKQTYAGKRVFITGNTGFKGSWLLKWLDLLGSVTHGYALLPDQNPSHFDLLSYNKKTHYEDINNLGKIKEAIEDFKPEIVFHLAAQPIVHEGYLNPIETFQTNTIGTANLLEAIRYSKTIEAVVCITTDKVYKNTENPNGYHEEMALGGYDPYSSSKTCAEFVINAYRDSFFNLKDYGNKHKVLIAAARGGNVVGGGDWAVKRLIPDIMRAYDNNNTLNIRNPQSVRPWQHVLDCLAGYLLLGAQLINKKKEASGAWNFGPITDDSYTVAQVVDVAKEYFHNLKTKFEGEGFHETNLLKLNCDKANKNLNYKPLLDTENTLKWTFEWYKNYYEKNEITTEKQILDYMKHASN